MAMTIAARFRFFSLGCSISRLTCARLSSPLMARMEWPKAMMIPNRPRIGKPEFFRNPSASGLKFRFDGVGGGGRCTPRTITE